MLPVLFCVHNQQWPPCLGDSGTPLDLLEPPFSGVKYLRAPGVAKSRTPTMSRLYGQICPDAAGSSRGYQRNCGNCRYSSGYVVAKLGVPFYRDTIDSATDTNFPMESPMRVNDHATEGEKSLFAMRGEIYLRSHICLSRRKQRVG
jgi:hypothetical protein